MTTVQRSSKKQHRLNDGEHSQPSKKQKRPNDCIAEVLSSSEKRISLDPPKPKRKKLYRRRATVIEREEYRLRKMISELKKDNTRLRNLLWQACPNLLRRLPRAIVSYIITFLDTRRLDYLGLTQGLNQYALLLNTDRTAIDVYELSKVYIYSMGRFLLRQPMVCNLSAQQVLESFARTSRVWWKSDRSKWKLKLTEELPKLGTQRIKQSPPVKKPLFSKSDLSYQKQERAREQKELCATLTLSSSPADALPFRQWADLQCKTTLMESANTTRPRVRTSPFTTCFDIESSVEEDESPVEEDEDMNDVFRYLEENSTVLAFDNAFC